MKLKKLREHYVTKDYGRTWIAKKPFKSIQEAKDDGYDLEKWHVYPCPVCSFYHVAKKGRRVFK